MKYTLRITAEWYDSKGYRSFKVNEFPISEQTALGLKHDSHGIVLRPTISRGSIIGDINVHILKDDEVIGGWRGI